MADLPGKIAALFSNETAQSRREGNETAQSREASRGDWNETATTETQIVSEISKGIWQDKCPYFVPGAGWQLIKTSDRLLLIPEPGHYFSQYNFSFSILPRKLTQDEFVYLYGPRDLEETPYERPEAAISSEAKKILDTLTSGPPLYEENEEPRAGRFTIRRLFSYEGEERIDNININIYQWQNPESQGESWSAEITLLGKDDGFPSWEKAQSGHPSATDFSCSATVKMNVKTFAALCSMLLEKHSLAPNLDPEACNEKGAH